jgi:hypothetical protein
MVSLIPKGSWREGLRTSYEAPSVAWRPSGACDEMAIFPCPMTPLCDSRRCRSACHIVALPLGPLPFRLAVHLKYRQPLPIVHLEKGAGFPQHGTLGTRCSESYCTVRQRVRNRNRLRWHGRRARGRNIPSPRLNHHATQSRGSVDGVVRRTNDSNVGRFTYRH